MKSRSHKSARKQVTAAESGRHFKRMRLLRRFRSKKEVEELPASIYHREKMRMRANT